MSHLVAGFLPLDKGKANKVCEGFTVSGEEGICFLQSKIQYVFDLRVILPIGKDTAIRQILIPFAFNKYLIAINFC